MASRHQALPKAWSVYWEGIATPQLHRTLLLAFSLSPASTPSAPPVKMGQFCFERHSPALAVSQLCWELTAAVLLSLCAFPQDVTQRSKCEKLLALKRVSSV